LEESVVVVFVVGVRWGEEEDTTQASIYKTAAKFLVQTRAEGWGLLAGNPTIAFVYLKPHGHMYDYMNSDTLVQALAGLLP